MSLIQLLGYPLFALVVGFLVPVQTALNAQLSRALGHPLLGTVANFTVGLLCLLCLVSLLRIPFPSAQMAMGTSISWWLGGSLGALFVAGSLFLAPRLGALNLFALVVVGQLVASVVFDHFGLLGYPQHPVSLFRLVGIGLLVLGVVLIQKF